MYARGGLANAATNGAFPASTTVSATGIPVATPNTHMISETTAVTITNLEVDGMICIRAYRDAVNDTCTDAVFLHTVDVHYQSTNMATKSKTAGAFYV